MSSMLLFYCSRRAVRAVPRRGAAIAPLARGQERLRNRVRSRAKGRHRRYPGLSRWTTLTRYPAVRNNLPTSSAIITERCCPPVQPNEMVR
jgi:hypothetical protein